MLLIIVGPLFQEFDRELSEDVHSMVTLLHLRDIEKSDHAFSPLWRVLRLRARKSLKALKKLPDLAQVNPKWATGHVTKSFCKKTLS